MIKKIYIVHNSRDLENLLSQIPDIHYLACGVNGIKEPSLAAKNLPTEDLLEYSDKKFNKACVDAYLQLLGTISLRYSSVFWFATFTSARNKFVSTLLPDLFLFSSIIRLLENKSYSHFLLIDPPSGIEKSLVKYCKKNKIDLEISSSGVVSWLSGIIKKSERLIIPTKFILSTWGKILICRLLFSGAFFRRISPDKPVYVLRTWIYDRSIDDQNNYHDAFFGVLPNYLQKTQNLVIIAGIIGDYLKIVRRIPDVKKFPIIPQEYFLGFRDPVRAVLDVRKNAVNVSGEILFLGNDISDILHESLARDYLHYAPSQYLYSFWINRLMRKIKIHTFTTTYENNPWEKVCFLTLRKNDPRIKIIGYQHAALALSSLNMIINPDEQRTIPLPDKVVTIGEITKTFLETRGSFPPDLIKTGCGLRFVQSPRQIKEWHRKKTHRVLVAPEGGLSESVNLVSFVFHALKNSPEIEVIIRSHPELPFEKYCQDLDFDISEYPQFVLSTASSVQDDLNASDILVYRGSSVAVEALKMGLAVIYVELNDILPVDTLLDMELLKWFVSDDNELIASIKQIYSMSDEEYLQSFREAQDYLKKYYYEVSEERMQVFL